jgi:nucleotide-binding universal stress UspA family protein
MDPLSGRNLRQIESILHPTDFSAASLTAFHHALKAALIAQSGLTLLHVDESEAHKSRDFPEVRETLARWGVLPDGRSRADVRECGIDVRKVVARQGDPVKGVLHYLDGHHVDLIVLATHQHEGRMSWLRQSVSEPIARHAALMTLFIPEGNAGFVSAADGSVSLKKILIPVAESPSPQPGVDAAARLAQRLNLPKGIFTLLHIGNTDTMPEVECPSVPGWEWMKMTRQGSVIQGIVDAARESEADVVVMSTDGRNGFLDGLRGSHSERVLRQVSTPLLTVPST